MPHRDLLSCFVEIGESTSRLREYGTAYHNRTVETYVAIPSKPTPFSIRLSTNGYVAPGLAVFVFIDGIYQTNRNRRGATPEHGKLEFHLGQKEDLLKEGRVIARGWWFEKLNIVSDKTKPTVNEDVLDNLGIIEVVVLRCEDDPASIPVDPWSFPQLPSIQGDKEENTGGGVSNKQSKKQKKNKGKAAANVDDDDGGFFGGMGIFDGACEGPPREPSRLFGGLDGHFDFEDDTIQGRYEYFGGLDGYYDIDAWRIDAGRVQNKGGYRHRKQQFDDNATRTSTDDSEEDRYRVPGAYYDADSDMATEGAKRQARAKHAPGRVHFRPSSQNRDGNHRQRDYDLRARSTSPGLRRETLRRIRYSSPHAHKTSRRVERPESPSQQDEHRKLRKSLESALLGPKNKTRHTSPVDNLRFEHDVQKTRRLDKSDHRGRSSTRKSRRRQRSIEAAFGSDSEGLGEDARSDRTVRRISSGSTYIHNLHERLPLYGPEFYYSQVPVPSPYDRVRASHVRDHHEQRRRPSHSTPFMQQIPPPWQPASNMQPYTHYGPQPMADAHYPQDCGLHEGHPHYQGPWVPDTDRHWYPPPPPHGHGTAPIHKHSRKTEDARTAKKIAELEGQLHRLRAGSNSKHEQFAHEGYGTYDPMSTHRRDSNKYFHTMPFTNPWSRHDDKNLDPKDRSESESAGWDSASTASGSKGGGENKSTTGWGETNQTNGDNNTDGWGGAATQTDNNNSGASGNDSGWPNAGNDQAQDTQQSGGWNETNNDSNNNANGGGGGWPDSGGGNNDDNQSIDNKAWDSSQQNGDQQDNNSDWGKDQNNNTWNNDEKKSDGKSSKKSSKKKKKRSGSDSSSSSSEEEKPYTRSYWASQVSQGAHRADANSSRKREKLTMPEDTIYTISKNEADEKKLKHQVRGGRGMEQQKKRGTKPLYWDNFEEPYAVFRFKYRSRDMLKKILGEDVKESKGEYKEWLNALSKEQLVAEMLRRKEDGDSDSEKGGKKSESKNGAGDGGWGESANNNATGSWETHDAGNGGSGGSNGGGSGTAQKVDGEPDAPTGGW